MSKAQYAILRFAKYKGPEIGRIEAHDERTKERYASNPDVDLRRSHLNFHLVKPRRSYRAEAERQIHDARCRVRSDSVRMVEALVTASPEFFEGKSPKEVRAFFTEALAFLSARQDPKTILSAVVHMDEKTPHMHLTFVPLTRDGHLSAKEILGNRKKLTRWQDEFWEHMAKKWPVLERGESAGVTGRTHIPPRLFKEAARLNRQREQLLQLTREINPLNARRKTAEIEALLGIIIPDAEKLKTKMKRYSSAFRELKEENAELEKNLNDSRESVLQRLEMQAKMAELEELRQAVAELPPEVMEHYQKTRQAKSRNHGGTDLIHGNETVERS